MLPCGGMRTLWQKLPASPGVYLMRDAKRRLLYVGKAANLRRRVQSYFRNSTNGTNRDELSRMGTDPRIVKLVSRIRTIDFKKTATALEALILEAALIKQHQPPWNVREKDDTSFLYVTFTKERFPRVLLARGNALARAGGNRSKTFGPFVQSGSVREALRILRKIFPWSTHDPRKVGTFKRPCLEYELGLCPGTCVGAADPEEYEGNIRRLKEVFQGKRRAVLRELARMMKDASAREEFEKAATYRRQLFALQHIQDVALISDDNFQFSTRLPPAGRAGSFEFRNSAKRIEGYDVSNISGTSATGSMVVFRGDQPARDEYRLFKIRSLHTPNDVGMLREVLTRRFKNSPARPSDLGRSGGWPLPDLVLVDGGKGQVNAAKAALAEAGLAISVVGLAKGPTRKRADLIGAAPKNFSLATLVRVRDEAHRFARSYHVKLRAGKQFAREI